MEIKERNIMHITKCSGQGCQTQTCREFVRHTGCQALQTCASTTYFLTVVDPMPSLFWHKNTKFVRQGLRDAPQQKRCLGITFHCTLTNNNYDNEAFIL